MAGGGGGAWATEGSAMARPLLSSDGTVVVPPMEAVWLSGAEWELHGGRGCLSFEVKGGWEERRRGGHAGLPRHSTGTCQSARIPSCAGDNDATVLLKQQSGSRRWQHLAVSSPAGGAAARAAAAAAAAAGAAAGGAAAGAGGAGPAGAEPAAVGRASPVEQNYTVILGSHRNSCLKFEKDGELCCMVSGGSTACAACRSHASQLAVVAEHGRLSSCSIDQLQQLHPAKQAPLRHPTLPHSTLPRFPSLAGPQVANAPGARLSSNTFRKYWINYDNGSIRWGCPFENHVGMLGALAAGCLPCRVPHHALHGA